VTIDQAVLNYQTQFPIQRSEEEEEKLMKGIKKADKILNQIISETNHFGPTIFASLDPKYHRPFARDTIISADLLQGTDLQTEKKADRAALRLWRYQTEGGKIPHEIEKLDPENKLYKRGFYHEVKIGEEVYMVNSDSVDSTPLLLIRTAEIYGGIENIPQDLLPRIKKALGWMINNMDESNGWLSYVPTERGLINQGWMDSTQGVVDENGKVPEGPIALVEAQALAWKALKIWSQILSSEELDRRASELKRRFNEAFYMEDKRFYAHALDGHGKQIKSTSINVGFCLWASYKGESIIYYKNVPDVIARFMASGFFNPEGGIKLFEDGQPTYDEEGYHNAPDVYWPFASYLVGKGMIRVGFKRQGLDVLKATNRGLDNPYHNGNFTEQYFNRNGVFGKYRQNNQAGDESCKNQAWSVAGYRWASEELLRELHGTRPHLQLLQA
jgi:glycogen debranching enzyme